MIYIKFLFFRNTERKKCSRELPLFPFYIVKNKLIVNVRSFFSNFFKVRYF